MRRPETRSSRTALSGEISSRRRGLSPPCNKPEVVPYSGAASGADALSQSPPTPWQPLPLTDLALRSWQDGKLMFSRVEVELIWLATVFVGVLYICWNTMPDGSGEPGKYM